jgi:NadR type nicotinamide-nucleotide adenylyltransferase
MEKRFAEPQGMIKIAIIGPECTGKTSLTKQLASYYNTVGVPEYAREYVENLNRRYNYDDVVDISKKQIEQLHLEYHDAKKYIFFDTDLIITNVWFEVVFRMKQPWIEKEILRSNIQLYLLCASDIPWTPDKVRENGGQMREALYEMYKQQLENRKFDFRTVFGIGDEQLKNAILAIESFFRKL